MKGNQYLFMRATYHALATTSDNTRQRATALAQSFAAQLTLNEMREAMDKAEAEVLRAINQ